MMREALGAKPVKTRLWSFCRPIDWYAKVFQQVALMQEAKTVSCLGDRLP